jgi:hypothetical protein
MGEVVDTHPLKNHKITTKDANGILLGDGGGW